MSVNSPSLNPPGGECLEQISRSDGSVQRYPDLVLGFTLRCMGEKFTYVGGPRDKERSKGEVSDFYIRRFSPTWAVRYPSRV